MNNQPCPYARGDSYTQYKCPILNKPCLYQHWCVNARVYQLTSAAANCRTKLKKDSE